MTLSGLPRRTSLIQRLSVLPLLTVFGWAAALRFANLDRLLWGSDELGNLLAGVRLHLLPWFNLGDPVRQNFFKSLAMPVHGLGDTVFFYVVVAVFRLLDIPVTEGHLFRAGATLSMVSLVLLFFFVRRLFGGGVGLVVLGLAAWNPALIGFAKNGFQVNFVIFLQIAILFGYLLHVSKNRWSYSIPMSVLMVLCAGSELFYLAPVLLMFHVAYNHTVTQGGDRGWTGQDGSRMGLLDWKNVLVWSGYGLATLVNLFLLLQVAGRVDLTLFGHLLIKRQHELSLIPEYGLRTFLGGFHAVVPWIPGFAFVAFGAAGLLMLANGRRPFAVFFVAYLALLAVLGYVIRFSGPYNFLHLLVPSSVVVGLAVVQVVERLLRRIVRVDGVSSELAGIGCLLVVLPFAAPWNLKVTGGPKVPEAYRSMKAVGYAVRELGNPQMRVMILSDQTYIPPTMEYYLGLPASYGDNGQPPRLYYLRALTEAYLPSRLAQRMGIHAFDYYVDFVKEVFSGKEQFLADLQASGVYEVSRLVSDGEVLARIYSPEFVPLRTFTLEEAEGGFDRKSARWERLFYDATVGTFYYYGVNY